MISERSSTTATPKDFKDCEIDNLEKDESLKDCLSDDEGAFASFPQEKTDLILIKANSSLPQGVTNIDQHDSDDPQCCVEYIDDIFEYLFLQEEKFYLTMKQKPAENWYAKRRELLLDWVVDVCIKFKILSEAYLLSAAIMDYAIRQPEMANLATKDIQLFGCTALWIASKLEMQYYPECRDFVYISDRAFNAKDLIAMEWKILGATKLYLQLPTSLLFLRRFSKAAQSDAKTHTLSKYLCEYCCISNDLQTKFKQSEIAAGAIYLARQSTNNAGWDETLKYYTRYTEDRAREIGEEIYKFVTTATTYKACKRKYASEKLLEVSKISLKNPKDSV